MKAYFWLLPAALIAASSAGSAATITFGGLPGNNLDPFTSYSEAGFTFSKTAGDAFVGKNYGNPTPSVFFGPTFGSAGATFELTAGGSLFEFGSVELAANLGSLDYTITGLLGGGTVFSFGATLPETIFTPISGSAGAIDTLVFALVANGSSGNIDNISVSITQAVPEPASWALMIGGFAMAGGMMRQRRSRRALAIA